MKIALIVIGVLLVAGLAVGGQFVSVRNDLVAQRESVNSAWSQVDVVLQRRADLIPNLVETVKGIASHETEVFKNIADARAALISGRTPQEKIQANDQLSGALARLLVVQKTIRNCDPTKISCGCRTSWLAPRTGSPSSAGNTTRRCSATTPRSRYSRIISSRVWRGLNATTRISPPNPERETRPK